MFAKLRKTGLVNYAVILGFFILILLAIPVINREITPCLKTIKGISYAYEKCNTVLILDRFMGMALSGFILSILLAYLTLRQPWGKSVKNIRDIPIKLYSNIYFYLRLTIFGLILAGLVIVAYFAYIPVAQKTASITPVYIENQIK